LSDALTTEFAAALKPVAPLGVADADVDGAADPPPPPLPPPHAARANAAAAPRAANWVARRVIAMNRSTFFLRVVPETVGDGLSLLTSSSGKM
jgi:hypothetical protein